MELKIIGRVILSVQIGVIHLVQQRLHRRQLFILSADSGKRGDARLNQKPRFKQLRNQFLLIRKAKPQRIMGKPRHRAQERSLSLTDIHDMLCLKDLDRLTHRRAAYTKPLHQFRLGGQLRAGLQGFLNDHFSEFIGNLFR